MSAEKVLIISDVNDANFNQLIKEKYPGSVVLSPENPIKPCVGCLSCWLRTPGKCVLNDSYSRMGNYMSESCTIIYISRCFFGGFSPFVKNVIDRSIAYVQPFFSKKGKSSGHLKRYKNRFDYFAVFYGENISEEEKKTALSLCRGNALLWNCNKPEVRFCENYTDAEELLP